MRAVIHRPLVFRRRAAALVKVDAVALEVMARLRQHRRRDVEAGGVLLGRYVVGCEDVIVDEVTVPMRGDRCTSTTFYRDARRHQEVIDARWDASRGTCQYLGEWHTHPEAIPAPSDADLADWRRRLRNDQFDSDSLLFVIVGTESVRAWEGLRSSSEVRALGDFEDRLDP